VSIFIYCIYAFLCGLSPVEVNMDESGGQDAEPSESTPPKLPPIVTIAEAGGLILDVTFETSKETLKNAKRAIQVAHRRPADVVPDLKARSRVAYRVDVVVLKKHSRYFMNLLSNRSFSEARVVEDTLAVLAASKLSLQDVQPKDLPCIRVIDDDEASHSALREAVFEDFLRILHNQTAKATQPNLHYATVLAVIADRFDCSPIVAKAVKTQIKPKWPVTNTKPLRDDNPKKVIETETLMRQKILVAWIFEMPIKLPSATREIILRGSSRWSPYVAFEQETTAAWWDLSEGLESKYSYFAWYLLPSLLV
jgi:hypothetical protein